MVEPLYAGQISDAFICLINLKHITLYNQHVFNKTGLLTYLDELWFHLFLIVSVGRGNADFLRLLSELHYLYVRLPIDKLYGGWNHMHPETRTSGLVSFFMANNLDEHKSNRLALVFRHFDVGSRPHMRYFQLHAKFLCHSSIDEKYFRIDSYAPYILMWVFYTKHTPISAREAQRLQVLHHQTLPGLSEELSSIPTILRGAGYVFNDTYTHLDIDTRNRNNDSLSATITRILQTSRPQQHSQSVHGAPGDNTAIFSAGTAISNTHISNKELQESNDLITDIDVATSTAKSDELTLPQNTPTNSGTTIDTCPEATDTLFKQRGSFTLKLAASTKHSISQLNQGILSAQSIGPIDPSEFSTINPLSAAIGSSVKDPSSQLSGDCPTLRTIPPLKRCPGPALCDEQVLRNVVPMKQPAEDFRFTFEGPGSFSSAEQQPVFSKQNIRDVAPDTHSLTGASPSCDNGRGASPGTHQAEQKPFVPSVSYTNMLLSHSTIFSQPHSGTLNDTSSPPVRVTSPGSLPVSDSPIMKMQRGSADQPSSVADATVQTEQIVPACPKMSPNIHETRQSETCNPAQSEHNATRAIALATLAPIVYYYCPSATTIATTSQEDASVMTDYSTNVKGIQTYQHSDSRAPRAPDGTENHLVKKLIKHCSTFVQTIRDAGDSHTNISLFDFLRLLYIHANGIRSSTEQAVMNANSVSTLLIQHAKSTIRLVCAILLHNPDHLFGRKTLGVLSLLVIVLGISNGDNNIVEMFSLKSLVWSVAADDSSKNAIETKEDSICPDDFEVRLSAFLTPLNKNVRVASKHLAIYSCFFSEKLFPQISRMTVQICDSLNDNIDGFLQSIDCCE